MEVSAQAGRRKACDYCVSRKIRCDGRKPTCSNCTLYGVACKITVSSRRRVAQRNKESTPVASSSQYEMISADSRAGFADDDRPGRMDALEERLANIEALLTMLTGPKSSAPETAQLPVQYPEVDLASSDDWNLSSGTCNETTDLNLTLFEPLPQASCVTTSDHLELAPLPEILPIVDNYFRNYNRLVPLFNETTFMRMLLDWYSLSSNRSMVSWAAINAVLALSYRILDDRSMDDPALSQCVRNIQSVLSQLMTRSEDLLGLQVLLGMAILYQGSSEFQFGIVLMGSVMRLAQSMRLHSKQSLIGLSKADALLRSRIFWIAYIFDRDMALRARAPYYQLDSETDLDHPEYPDDGLGIINSETDGVHFNYLRARVHLALIQGRANDLLYSHKAHKLTQQQKAAHVSRTEDMLHEWQATIPSELQHAEGVRQRLSPTGAQLMLHMFYRQFECMIKIRCIFSFDDAWISRVHRYLSPAVIEIKDDEPDGEVVRTGLTPLPGGWAECVERGRLCVELLTARRQTEHALW
ncbi:hypothetical protein ACJ41O_014790 [Fusarium nematophilum]